MFQYKNKTILNLILIFSIIALISAYFIEHVLGHKPCNLCLIERLPYILSIIIILTNFIVRKFEKYIFIFLSFIFLCATVVSFYHFGIEQGFFKESIICDANNVIENMTKEDLLNELQKKTISCKNVSFTLFGLSLAAINTIVSIILSVINFKSFINYEKNK
tara:strand:+ start:106 stop:591 length:486 start_codon:yes stop_codon:yes gene_type:complete